MLVTIRKTGFHFSIDQIRNWLELFGRLESNIEYKPHPRRANLKQDSLEVLMRLRKHILATLPAYGKKFYVNYRGQPVQCSGCLELGHIRKNCTNERNNWSKYVKEIQSTKKVPDSYFGSWLKPNDSNTSEDTLMENSDDSLV